MNLIIDIGNTRTKYYAFKHNSVALQEAEEGSTLRGMCAFVARSSEEQHLTIDHAIVSSTVDYSNEALERLNALPCPILFFTSQTPTPLAIDYKTPETLGPDRLAAAVGAWSQCKRHPLIVIDVGTCITVDYVAKDGVYMGGNISPGLNMRLKAMHDYTGHLPLVDFDGCRPKWGFDTETALRSGVYVGIYNELVSYIDSFRSYRNARAFITGGDAGKVFDTGWNELAQLDPHLVARGLHFILKYNLKLAKHS